MFSMVYGLFGMDNRVATLSKLPNCNRNHHANAQNNSNMPQLIDPYIRKDLLL